MAHSKAIFCSWVNRFWKNLSVMLSDDSVALWTAALRERTAER